MRPQAFQTRLTDLFGIRHPILCGGLMWLADATYVAAVVRAGGMGFLTAISFPDPDHFREEVRRCKSLSDGMPFGVNISVSRRQGVIERYRPHVRITCEEGVRFVETSGSSPEPILGELREAGVKVIHKVPALRYAQSVERLPIDAVSVVGGECGGHPGTMMIGTMVQAAQVRDQLRLPVAIGGGIGTGRQMLACLAMGADAILMGSRMLAAEEIWAHPNYKRRVVAGDGTDSVVVMQSFKGHHRVLDNDAARAVLALEGEGIRDFDRYADLVSGEAVREAYASGDFSRGMIDWGQATAFANEVKSVEEIFDEIIDDALAARARLDAVTAGLADPVRLHA